MSEERFDDGSGLWVECSIYVPQERWEQLGLLIEKATDETGALTRIRQFLTEANLPDFVREMLSIIRTR